MYEYRVQYAVNMCLKFVRGEMKKKETYFKNLEVIILICIKSKIGRILALICTIIIAFAVVEAPAFADEEPIDFGQFYGVVDTDVLNVRAYADPEAPVVAEVSKYAYVKINWVEPDWVCVAYNNDGLMGYVSSDYINIFEGEMPVYSGAGQAAVNVAAQFLGVPYVWGGTSPSGFDCSGLMQYVYKQLGYTINRVAEDQMKNGVPVSRENLQPGDLVGFYSSPGGGYIGHIGMYVGNGIMIHAPHTGDVVRYAEIDSGYYYERFAGGRRIIY